MDPQPGASLIIAFQIKSKHVLVIGGGDVAMGRVNALLSADAVVTLVAPELTNSALRDYVKIQQEEPDLSNLIFIQKTVVAEKSEATGADCVAVEDLVLDQNHKCKFSLVLTAINTNTGVSEKVYNLCSVQNNVPVNVADVPPMCDFYFASMIRRGPLQVAVSTGGSAPRLARRIRLAIERSVDDLGAVDKAIENISRLRQALRTGNVTASLGKAATQEERVAIIKARMKWMSQVCDAWSIDEMAQIDDDDVQFLVASYPESVSFEQVKTNALNAPLD